MPDAIDGQLGEAVDSGLGLHAAPLHHIGKLVPPPKLAQAQLTLDPGRAVLAIPPVVVAVLVELVHVVEPLPDVALLFGLHEQVVLPELLVQDEAPVARLEPVHVEGAAGVLQDALALEAALALDRVVE